MKVGISVTYHYSDIRPKAKEDIKRYITSLSENINYNYCIYVIDNQSKEPVDIEESDNLKVTTIRDSDKKNITRGFNQGIYNAYEDGCNIIINTNDDLTFDDSINDFIKIINEHEHNDVGLYGPVCNTVNHPNNSQKRKERGGRIIETTDHYPLNGFFLGFTGEMFENFHTDYNLFSNKEPYKIHAQEVELWERNTPKGMRSFIIENCFVNHIKYRAWKKL